MRSSRVSSCTVDYSTLALELECGNASFPDGLPFLVNVPAHVTFCWHQYAIPFSVISEVTLPCDLSVAVREFAPARGCVNACDFPRVCESEFQRP
jgi:hypothetical protein